MKWGKVNYKQLQKLRDNLQKLNDVDLEKFCEDASKRLAARLLQLVIPATPVGTYPKGSGKKGGTLRRGWTAATEAAATKGSGSGQSRAEAYANSLPVFKQGRNYYIEVVNPVKYASYVEFGHRTPGGKGWVPGKYFLTISERKLESVAPAILAKELDALLREAFNV